MALIPMKNEDNKTGSFTAVTDRSAGSARVYQRGSIVNISMVIYASSNYPASSYFKVGTVSGVTLPSAETRFPVSTADNRYVAAGRINTSGEIEIYNYGSTAGEFNVTFNFTYMV